MMIRILAIIVSLGLTTTVFAETHSTSRDMTLDAEGVKTLAVDVRAGGLRVTGDKTVDAVSGRATINIESDDPAFDAQDYMEDHVRLTLERDGCDIDDGSGDLAVRNVTGHCRIDDGSGELRVRTVRGKVTIDDGSGHLFVTDVEGDVRLDDGSGDIVVRGVTGEIEIEEAGSGDVRIDTDGTEGSR